MFRVVVLPLDKMATCESVLSEVAKDGYILRFVIQRDAHNAIAIFEQLGILSSAKKVPNVKSEESKSGEPK